MLDFELDKIDGIENLSLKDLDNLIKAGEDNSGKILILLDKNLDISKILELYNQGVIKTIAKDGVRLTQLESVCGLEEIIEIYNKDKTLYKRLVKDPDELIEKYGFEGAKEQIEEASNRHQERWECPGYEPGDSYGEEDSYDEACYVSPLYRYSSDDSQNIHTSGSSDKNNDDD